jgi:hypothetical protein
MYVISNAYDLGGSSAALAGRPQERHVLEGVVYGESKMRGLTSLRIRPNVLTCRLLSGLLKFTLFPVFQNSNRSSSFCFSLRVK